MKQVSFLLVLLFTSGCSSGIINIPSEEVIDSSGKIITKTASTVGDASTYRTHEKYKAWNIAHTEYTKAVKASGFKMSFAIVDISGTKLYLPKEISFREAPQFHAPAELHDHPIWGTVNKFISTVTPWGFGTWAATSIVSSMEHVANRPTNQYQGPVQMTGSYNTAGRDQNITANSPMMDQGYRDRSPGCSNGDCGESGNSEFNLGDCIANPPAGNNGGFPQWTPGCSCTSHSEGKC